MQCIPVCGFTGTVHANLPISPSGERQGWEMCFEVSLLSHLLSPTLGAGSHALRAVGLRQRATVRNPGFSMELATAATPLTSWLLGQQGIPEHGNPSSEPGTIQLGGQDARCAGASASQETQKILKSHISVLPNLFFPWLFISPPAGPSLKWLATIWTG